MRSPNMRKLRGAARAIFATQTFGLNVLQLLSALDDRLVAALEAGDIRLLRSAWLLKQTGTFRLLCRQDLETKDGDGLNSALLSCEEAVRLIRRCDRSVGAVTHGWLTPGDPDPDGRRLDLVQRALRANPGMEGLFWDFASLHQPSADGQRTEAEEVSASITAPPQKKPHHLYCACIAPRTSSTTTAARRASGARWPWWPTCTPPPSARRCCRSRRCRRGPSASMAASASPAWPRA